MAAKSNDDTDITQKLMAAAAMPRGHGRRALFGGGGIGLMLLILMLLILLLLYHKIRRFLRCDV